MPTDQDARREAIDELLAQLAGAIGQLVLQMRDTIADIHRLLDDDKETPHDDDRAA